MKFADAMEAQGDSINVAARRLGVSRQCVLNWKSGKHKPRPGTPYDRLYQW